MEELSELIKKKPLETSVNYKNYNEVVEKIESLNERIEAIGRSVKNNSWLLDKSKEKLMSIQNDISGKEAYLNNLHKEAEFPIKKAYISAQKQKLEEITEKLENEKCELKEILSEEEKLKADEERAREKYNELKKKLGEQVRKSVESVCEVIKKEVKDGPYGENSIYEVLKGKEINNFFTEDKIKDVPKGKWGYKYESCDGDYDVKNVLKNVLEGKQVSEEDYEGFVEKILEKLCNCDRYKNSENIKPESSNIVMVRCDFGFIKYADFPVLFQKDSSLYEACELYMKINRRFSSSFNFEKGSIFESKECYEAAIHNLSSSIEKIGGNIQCLVEDLQKNILDIKKREEEYLKKLEDKEKQIPGIKESIGKLEKDISQAQQEMSKLIDERTELKKQEKALGEQLKTNEENNKRAMLIHVEKIKEFRKNIVEKYSKESWFKKIAVKDELLGALECS